MVCTETSQGWVKDHLCNNRWVETSFLWVKYWWSCCDLWRIMQHYSFYWLFRKAVDKKLWDVFGQFYHIVLWHVPVPSRNLLLLTAVADMLHNMIDSIFQWQPSLLSTLLRLVIYFCDIFVGWFVASKEPFPLQAAYFWAVLMLCQKISCCGFRLVDCFCKRCPWSFAKRA